VPGGGVRGDRHTALGLIVALIVLAADQASKYWVVSGLELPRIGDIHLLSVLDLTWVQNRGVTFGLLNGIGGAWSSAALAVFAVLVVGVLGLWLRRTPSRLTAGALGAIAGGALGNVIDRLRFGWVVDFINAHVGQWHWPVFNIADTAIVCGVAVLILQAQFARRESPAGERPRGDSLH
jgi:signal peptidase II